MGRLLPSPFQPQIRKGVAIVGVCLIRLEEVRPAFLPRYAGIASENAAHRIAVEWPGSAGVYIPRRDTDSRFNHWVGGRWFPGEQHRARFRVQDDGHRVQFGMESADGDVRIRVLTCEANTLPAGSVFESLDDASEFFRQGSIGYSARTDGGPPDGIRLRIDSWRMIPLRVYSADSSFFAGSLASAGLEYDSAFLMRDIEHEWESVPAVAECCD